MVTAKNENGQKAIPFFKNADLDSMFIISEGLVHEKMDLITAGFIAGKIITIKKVRGRCIQVIDIIRAVLAPAGIGAA